ncbi:hypothetical protein, partial [Burkholderia sp. MSMB2157WGS]|uniref:hypothetical protein n=1 Tax=Burkholderia sp. MSMB2157WGS TaxID=1637928 RepID=UPI001C54E68E
QRSEIMNRVSQLVNNFLHYIVATAGPSFCAVGLVTSEPQQSTASLPSAPRFRWRERGVILCIRPRPRKPFVKKD